MGIVWQLCLVLISIRHTESLSEGSANIFGLLRDLPYFFIPKLSPEVFMRTGEMIVYYGYAGETYTIQTEDGYLCDLFRVRGKNGITKQTPVLMIHGFFTSPYFWLVNKPGNSLGFDLADAGYDVWIGSLRGSSYCMRHIKLKTTQKEFWKFSWDENGNYDIAAYVDHIRNVTGKPKVVLMGHSKGTSSIYALLSNRTEYLKKVKGVVILASVTDLYKISAPGILLAFVILPLLELLTAVTGIYTYPPLPSPGLQLCQLFPALCILGNSFTEGVLTQQTDYSRTAVAFSHLPDFTSLQDIKHFYQSFRRQKFQAFDYGSEKENKKHYGTAEPPVYDLSKITVPVAMFWGSADHVASSESAERTRKQLPNVIAFHKVPFTHIDYFLAIDLRKLLIEPVLKILDKWN